MFSCAVCEFFTSGKGHLTLHVERNHEKKYKCSYCGFVGGEKKERDVHLERKHKKELHYCSLCDYWAVRKTTLLSHFNRVHGDIKNFKCRRRECDYIAYSKGDLVLHITSFHENDFKYDCKLCEYSCLRFYDLRRHKLRIHNME